MDYKAGYFDAGGNAISGSGDLTLRCQRDADYWFLDFNDMAFKAIGHVTLDLAMAEPDAVNAPGWYWGQIPDEDIANWNDGVYTVYINSAGVAAPPPWHDIIEFRIVDGVVTTGAAESLSTQSRADVRSSVQTTTVEGAVNVQELLTRLAAILGDANKIAGWWEFQRPTGTVKVRRRATLTSITTVNIP